MVEMIKPTALTQAIHLAKKQESILESILKNDKSGGKNQVGNNKPWRGAVLDTNNTKKAMTGDLDKYPPVKKLTPEELDLRRKK